MLARLIGNLLTFDLYVQIRERELRVMDLKTGRVWSDEPLVAVDGKGGKKVIAAVGAEARSRAAEGIEVVNPFSHPRTLLSDFSMAEKLLQHAIREIAAGSLLRASPRVLIQPREKLDGGLTQIEERGFRELALGAGARSVVVWVGKELIREEAQEWLNASRD